MKPHPAKKPSEMNVFVFLGGEAAQKNKNFPFSLFVRAERTRKGHVQYRAMQLSSRNFEVARFIKMQYM